MDLDPELDVTLSDGREAVTFRIAALQGAVEAWAIVEPFAPMTVVVGRAVALERRSRVDRLIADRLAAGWVPLDPGRAAAPLVAPTPLPRDLVLQLSSLVEALAQGRAALRAADPFGQLWAACARFMQQARHLGIGAPGARVVRARRERRLGELAEQAGHREAAILHYQAALASHAGIGIKRRLARLAPPGPAATPTPDAPLVKPAAAGTAPTRPVSGRAPCRRLGRPRASRRSTHNRRDVGAAVSDVCRRGHRLAARRDRGRGERVANRGAAGRADRGGSAHAAPGDRSRGARARHAPAVGEAMKQVRAQIVGRIPRELSRRVRAAAKRRKVTLNAWLTEALAQAVGRPRQAREWRKGA